MPNEIRKVIAIARCKADAYLHATDWAEIFRRELHAAGYEIVPSPESLTDEQVSAALRKDAEVTALVRERKMTMGGAFRAVYREAIAPPKESE